ncbi:hypothetical protein, variant [Aphanomyces astaci]|uniref:Uncharacterized protein n=1 Tax=Aphanomyces astaci TaxID=112090 RepID=W4GQV2_APHAT|nr:hypothetical protein H257_05316 [Aphanomyces astaci]XP_009828458.1 hypothetical protein, variant [Aphanomyces astaci]ETV81720.1 hypothetical protein H257_05316 [Aphanomyces astaci]ETV81721.1 hypothetical protein, variant [Aphanomyces astaci]|eukprot:XP_009828457.1 hypothetical protein H257_05316 [Aphanomyces astaci]
MRRRFKRGRFQSCASFRLECRGSPKRREPATGGRDVELVRVDGHRGHETGHLCEGNVLNNRTGAPVVGSQCQHPTRLGDQELVAQDVACKARHANPRQSTLPGTSKAVGAAQTTLARSRWWPRRRPQLVGPC